MQPFIVQGRDKVTLAALPDRIKKYDIILYKRENGTFVLHRVTGKKENAYIFRGDNQFSDEYGIKREQMIGKNYRGCGRNIIGGNHRRKYGGYGQSDRRK